MKFLALIILVLGITDMATAEMRRSILCWSRNGSEVQANLSQENRITRADVRIGFGFNSFRRFDGAQLAQFEIRGPTFGEVMDRKANEWDRLIERMVIVDSQGNRLVEINSNNFIDQTGNSSPVHRCMIIEY